MSLGLFSTLGALGPPFFCSFAAFSSFLSALVRSLRLPSHSRGAIRSLSGRCLRFPAIARGEPVALHSDRIRTALFLPTVSGRSPSLLYRFRYSRKYTIYICLCPQSGPTCPKICDTQCRVICRISKKNKRKKISRLRCTK